MFSSKFAMYRQLGEHDILHKSIHLPNNGIFDNNAGPPGDLQPWCSVTHSIRSGTWPSCIIHGIPGALANEPTQRASAAVPCPPRSIPLRKAAADGIDGRTLLGDVPENRIMRRCMIALSGTDIFKSSTFLKCDDVRSLMTRRWVIHQGELLIS